MNNRENGNVLPVSGRGGPLPGLRNISLLVILIVLLLLAVPVSADPSVGGLPLTTVRTGTVSGGVYMDANNNFWGALPGPQNVQKTFTAIPNVNNIQWARLYVSVYCGHMQNNYQGTSTVTFDGNGDGTYETALGTETLNVPYVYPGNGGNDNTALGGGLHDPYKMLNNHANRVTSDYLMWYDVTSAITSQTPKAQVVTTASDGSFDGRIKVITLVVAYNDGDSDTIYYWVNQGHDTDTLHSTTDYIGSTDFDLSSLTGTVQSATLMVNHMASEDGSYSWWGDAIATDPAGGNGQGAYFGYNIWDMTSSVSMGNTYDLAYDRIGEYYKIPLAILTVKKQTPVVQPVTNFGATPLSGTTPLTVKFTDLTTNKPTSWTWYYRLGSGSYIQFNTTQNPTFTFTTVGSYSIRLTTANSAGSNTKTSAAGYIIVNPAANIDLTVTDVRPVTSTLFARETNAVRTTVKNIGGVSSSATTLQLVASDGFSGSAAVPVLASNAETIVTILDTTNRNLAGASVTYTATVDPGNTVAEGNEGNNVMASPFTVTYNGYKGKRYWNGGSDVTTKKTFDLHGNLLYSSGNSTYRSGGVGGGAWNSYTVTWTGANLPVPAGATVREARLYVPYTWDNSNQVPDHFSATFNGHVLPDDTLYKDESNFGGYDNYYYGLLAYNVTSYFSTAGNNVIIHKDDSGSNLAMYGLTLAVVYEKADEPRRQIFMNEEFDILGADADGYATTPDEATAYVPFSGMTITPANVATANLITFVPSGNGPEGILLFNGNTLGTNVWDYGLASGTQVAVDTRDVKSSLTANGNEGGIRSTAGATPLMAASHEFLVVTYTQPAPVAAFSGTPLSGNAPLSVKFTDASTGSITSRSWDFTNDGIVDSTEQSPTFVYTAAGTYTVNLTVSGPGGKDSEIKTAYVSVSTPPAPPVAAFSGTPLSGNAPLSVKFTDASTGSITSRAWDFTNDGIVDSTEQSPTFVYTAAGTYTVNLTVSGPGGKDSEIKTAYVSVSTPPAPPVAAFSGTPLSGNAPLSVKFTDASTGSITSRAWDFTNDGIVDSTEQSPTFVYTAAGTYTVNLTVSGPGGKDSEIKTAYVSVSTPPAPPVAAFSGTPLSGNAPLSVKFTDASTGSITSRAWDFTNDGIVDSTEQSPTFVYTAAGTYTVNLTVSGPGGKDSEIKTAYVSVSTPPAPPVAAFSGTPLSGNAPLSVKFTDASTGSITSRAWDFTNDGIVDSTEQSPTFVYTAAGTYTVNLTVSGPGGKDSEIKTAYVSVSTPPAAPVAAFSGTPLSGNAPLSVKFTDASTGSITSRAWDFNNDGTVDSTEQSPTFVYTNPGTFTVNLTVSGPGGKDSEIKTAYVSVSTPPAAPVAAFSGTPLAGNAPLSVKFTDASTGSITSRSWDFTNDGIVDSTEQSPTFVYTNPGTFTVNLTVTGPGGKDSEIKTAYVSVSTPPAPPVAAFSGTPLSGNAPLSVKFTDASTGSITSRSWDFDNNGIIDSTEQSPTFVYTNPGTYTVNLTVTGPGGKDSEIKTAYVSVSTPPAPPVAAFSGTPLSGNAPLSVKFTDASTGSITSRSWDFTNDGIVDSTEQSPTFVYTNPGTFTVNLTVSGPGGKDSEIKTAYVSVSTPPAAPVAAFSGTPLSGNAPLSVKFTDASTGSISSYAWDFNNDGTVDSTEQSPTFVYTNPGTFTVNLTVSGPGGKDSEIKTDYISVLTAPAAPVAAFSGTPLSGNAPLSVKFTDASTGSITSRSWDFTNDGIVDSTEQSPTFVYTNPGTYTVNLTVFGPGGKDSEIKTDYISVLTAPAAPVAAFSGTPLSGNAPLSVKFTDASTGSITSRSWDFTNDGIVDSTEQSPTFVYTNPGTYTVNLTVFGPGGKDSEIKTDYISVLTAPAAPVAAFSGTPLSGNAPLSVKFTDASTGSITSRSWDFTNDGIVDSTEQSPTFVYTNPGTYTVNLTVFGPGGKDSEIKTAYVSVSTPTGSISVTSPNGGEKWKRGNPYPITWKYAGSPGSSVSIVLFRGDTQVYTIASSVSIGSDGSGSFTWNIPADKPLGSDYKVRVQSVSQPSIKDLSDNQFSIVADTVPISSITVTSPNGGEKWKRGNPYPITWKYTGSPGSSVSIVLFQGDTQVYTVASSVSIGSDGSGSFTWNIPADKPLGSDYKVRIQSVSQPSIKDLSDNQFSIVADTVPISSITVTSPNGGEKWKRGNPYPITWKYTGSPGSSVSIVLFQGDTQVYTVASSVSIGSDGSGSFTWNIPADKPLGSDYKVRIQSVSQPSIKDLSDNQFSIVADTVPISSITVTSPNGGEKWKRGNPYPITWKYTGSPGSSVSIVLFQGDTQVYTVASSVSIGSDGSGSFTWNIPADKPLGSDYKVRIQSVSQPSIKDLSDNQFSIVADTVPISSISVTSPNSGDTWKRGTSHTVTWDYSGNLGSTVKIMLLKGGIEVGTIASSVPTGSNGKGSYSWQIYPSGGTGSNYKVSVQSISQPAIKDTSNSYFTIAPAVPNPKITITSPNGGETWKRGTSHTVTWDYSGSPGSTVKIMLLKGGIEVGTISTGTSIGRGGHGSYTWPIYWSGSTGNDYKISVKSISQPAIKDTSNNDFTLTKADSTPKISVTSPNGGDTWKRGTTKTITWSYNGDPGSTVKIMLLKGGIEVGTIASSVPTGSNGKGSYSWQIYPSGGTGSNYKVSVQSSRHPTIKDSSNNDFTLTL